MPNEFPNQNQADTPAARGYYRRNEWRPTWTVNFGAHKDMTLHSILRQHGPLALLPYRQRAVNKIAAPRNPDHKVINSTMLAHIDALLKESGYTPPDDAQTQKAVRG